MASTDKNIYAAIALALHEFKGNNVHDKEPGIITIKPKATLWKPLGFRLISILKH